VTNAHTKYIYIYIYIHVDDSNLSDHYAISCLVHTDNTQKVQSSAPSKKAVKLMWDKADLDLYRSVLQLQLSRITIPTDALLCDHCMCSEQHELLLDKYYNDIVNCLATVLAALAVALLTKTGCSVNTDTNLP